MTTPKQIVESHVIHSVTNLIWTLKDDTSALPLEIAEQIDTAYFAIDYDQTFENWYESLDDEELLEAAENHDLMDIVKTPEDPADDAVIDWDLTSNREVKAALRSVYDDAKDEFIADEGIDLGIAEVEVFEHWAVDRYLAMKLIGLGEKVIEDIFDFSYVWCRTTTGQMIEADNVIERIAEGR